MITKLDIIKAAHEHGFEDIGFTTADPFFEHKQLLLDRREEYEWAEAARRGSWTLPIAIVIDADFEPGVPTMEIGCPDWCKNACIAACPTGALKGNCRIDPRKCISYLTYFGEGITPLELREPL